MFCAPLSFAVSNLAGFVFALFIGIILYLFRFGDDIFN